MIALLLTAALAVASHAAELPPPDKAPSATVAAPAAQVAQAEPPADSDAEPNARKPAKIPDVKVAIRAIETAFRRADFDRDTPGAYRAGDYATRAVSAVSGDALDGMTATARNEVIAATAFADRRLRDALDAEYLVTVAPMQVVVIPAQRDDPGSPGHVAILGTWGSIKTVGRPLNEHEGETLLQREGQSRFVCGWRVIVIVPAAGVDVAALANAKSVTVRGRITDVVVTRAGYSKEQWVTRKHGRSLDKDYREERVKTGVKTYTKPAAVTAFAFEGEIAK